jgi:hypothetical protein
MFMHGHAILIPSNGKSLVAPPLTVRQNVLGVMAATRHWLTLCYSARFCVAMLNVGPGGFLTFVDKMPSIGRYSRRLLSVPTVLGTMIGAPPNSCSAREQHTTSLQERNK